MSESHFVAPQHHKDFETKRYFLQCRSHHAINLLFLSHSMLFKPVFVISLIIFLMTVVQASFVLRD